MRIWFTWDKTIKLQIADALLWCLLCALLIAGSLNRGAVRQYSSVSLRYDAPISGQAAYAARLYSISQNDQRPFWPAFWKEHTATIKSEFVTADVDCISFSGDAALVWPAAYISGASPGVVDDHGCSVSEALAWRLWGSSDVVGMSVDVDGAARIVRGVFKNANEMALISYRDENTSQSWTAVELSGGPADCARGDAESFALASGLGKPDAILMRGPSSVAGFLAAAPLLILCVYGLALLISGVGKRFPAMRAPFLFMILIALAALAPPILDLLPSWSVPTRWSDFSFWVSLLDQASSGLREFFRAAPGLRDVELRMLLVSQASIALAAICVSLSVCFRWQIRRRQVSI